MALLAVCFGAGFGGASYACVALDEQGRAESLVTIVEGVAEQVASAEELDASAARAVARFAELVRARAPGAGVRAERGEPAGREGEAAP